MIYIYRCVIYILHLFSLITLPRHGMKDYNDYLVVGGGEGVALTVVVVVVVVGVVRITVQAGENR